MKALFYRFLAFWLAVVVPSAPSAFGDVVVVVGRGVAAAGPVVRTDDFNRANGSLGGNWTVQVGSGWTIDTNEVVTTETGADQLAYYSAATFAANQYSRVRCSGGAGQANKVMAIARASGTGSANCYWVRKDRIAKHVAGSFSNLLLDDAGDLVDGSYLTIKVYASGSDVVIERWVDADGPGAGAAVMDGTFTDTTNLILTGSPGIGAFSSGGANPEMDDWEGGDL